jgi:hypothetical protein
VQLQVFLQAIRSLFVGFYVGSEPVKQEVQHIQETLHPPTWILALVTSLANITFMYRNWKRNQQNS